MAFVSILLNKRKIFPKTDWNIVKGIWKIQCKMPPKTKKILPPENIQ